MIRVILVDDEEPALLRLDRMIAEHTDLQIVGRFTKPKEALAAVAALRPQAAFLEIEMPGLNGLDLAALLMERQPLLEAVMVTASSDYAYQAFKANAIDYLLKPAGAEELQRCAERLARRIGASAHAPGVREPDAAGQARIVCLGGFEVFAPKRPEPLRFATAKAEELFAYLLVNRGMNVSKWTLCERIWPGHDPEKAEQNLHSTVFRLKKTCLDAGFPLELVSQRGQYRFVLPAGCRCDLHDFESAAEASGRNADNEAREAGAKAIAAYKGSLFAGKSYPWVESLSQGLERRFAAIAKSHADQLAASGEGDRAIETLCRLTEKAPYDEDGHERLLEAYLLNKDRSAFLLHYQRVDALLRDMFGLEPGEGLRRLHKRMTVTLK